MIITTIDCVPGKEIKEFFGFVSASTMRTKNIDKDIGANAIVGMKIGTSSIMQGASEVIAYGTAVLIE